MLRCAVRMRFEQLRHSAFGFVIWCAGQTRSENWQFVPAVCGEVKNTTISLRGLLMIGPPDKSEVYIRLGRHTLHRYVYMCAHVYTTIHQKTNTNMFFARQVQPRFPELVFRPSRAKLDLRTPSALRKCDAYLKVDV